MKNRTIVQYGIPRSGSTAMWQVLTRLCAPEAVEKKVLPNLRSNYQVGPVIKIHDFVAAYANPQDYLIIGTIRHPFDIFCSFMRIYNHPLPKDENLSVQARDVAEMIKKQFATVERFKTMSHAHIIRYETWAGGNWNNLFDALEPVLGITISTASRADIALACSREENAKISKSLKVFAQFDQHTLIHGNHIADTVTDWKLLLSPATQTTLVTLFKTELANNGYETLYNGGV